MSKFTVLEPKNIYRATLNIYSGGSVELRNFHQVSWQSVNNKYAVLADSASALDALQEELLRYRIITPGPVFVSAFSKLPRTLLRNSGYTITLKKETAKYILTPRPESPYTWYASYVYWDDDADNLFLFDTNLCFITSDTYSMSDETQKRIEEAITEKIGKAVCLFAAKTSSGSTCVSFYPKIVEYKEILEGNKFSGEYCGDWSFPMDPPTDLNLDSLKLWTAMMNGDTSKETVERLILNSPWQRFPQTLKLFCKHNGMRYDIKVAAFRGLMTELERTTTITPEDYSLLQEYILDKYCAKEYNRYYVLDNPTDIPDTERSMLLSKAIVVKRKLPCEMTVKQLRDLQ